MHIVGCQHVVGHVSLINVHVGPLSALCLMACGSIGELHLHGIIVAVHLDLLDAVGLMGNIGIVLHYLII